MRPIKFLLAALLLLSFSVNAQTPSGFPITNSKGWIKYGYVQNDSGRIDAARDTNWIPRFTPTTVYWQKQFWTWNGSTWVKTSYIPAYTLMGIPVTDDSMVTQLTMQHWLDGVLGIAKNVSTAEDSLITSGAVWRALSALRHIYLEVPDSTFTITSDTTQSDGYVQYGYDGGFEQLLKAGSPDGGNRNTFVFNPYRFYNSSQYTKGAAVQSNISNETDSAWYQFLVESNVPGKTSSALVMKSDSLNRMVSIGLNPTYDSLRGYQLIFTKNGIKLGYRNGAVYNNASSAETAIIGLGVNSSGNVSLTTVPSGSSTVYVVIIASDGTLKKINSTSINAANIYNSDGAFPYGSIRIATGNYANVSFNNLNGFSVQSKFNVLAADSSGYAHANVMSRILNGSSFRAYTQMAATKGDSGNWMSLIQVFPDSIAINPFEGKLMIDTLNKAAGNVQLRYNTTTGAVSYLDTLHSLTLLTHRGIKITASVTGDSVYIDDFVKVATTTSASTITPNCDTTNMYTVTALATNPTFADPSGTPYDGQPLTIRVKDNGTSRSLTWNGIYRAGTDVALPTATTISKQLYSFFIYNAADSKWDLINVKNGF